MIIMNRWREDAMDGEHDAPQSVEAPAADPADGQQAEQSHAPVMLMDAMCGCAAPVKAEPPLA